MEQEVQTAPQPQNKNTIGETEGKHNYQYNDDSNIAVKNEENYEITTDTIMYLPTSRERNMVKVDNSVEKLDEKIETMMERSEGTWKCKLCERSVKLKSHIKSHIEANHIEGISLPCNMCGKQFRSRASLQVHTSLYHRT
jgi:CRISPR/Cas system CMR-associated protein Cmr3 (group 5 of RAMP superfamily)